MHSESACAVFDFNHLILFLEEARFFNTSLSSWSLYCPTRRVSRRNDDSIILVRQSANWAPECTHLRDVPSDSKSLMALAANWVRNSEHCGGAVLVTRSYRDLQSVAATLSGNDGADMVAVEIDSGNCLRASLGLFHWTSGFNIHPQQRRVHDSWSKTEASETVSAAKVLVTTL